MSAFLVSLNPQALILLRLSAMLLFAFCFSRVTKLLRLPNVTGYILSGIVIGPYVLGLVSAGMADAMSFLTDIALAFIAFGTGKYFKWAALKQSGLGIVTITVLEALMAALMVTAAMALVFHLPLPFSLLLGAIASATAPASTLMTIRQYKAKGPFVNTVLQVVVLDDAVALIAFSVCATAAQIVGAQQSVNLGSVVLPIFYNLAAVGLGGAAAFLLRLLMRHVLSAYNHLLMTVIFLLGLSGACAAVNISPLLSCMVFGTVHANISKGNTVFKRVNRFSPPVLTLFFVVSGMRLNVGALPVAGITGVAYFLIRIVGKYLGASLGAVLARGTAEVKKYLGLALIPQAGVSIGLAALGERILPHDMGMLLSTIILSSSVLYEIVGPAAAKFSMHLAGAIPAQSSPDAPTASLPPARIKRKKMNPKQEMAAEAGKDALPSSPCGAPVWQDFRNEEPENDPDGEIRLGTDTLAPFRKRWGE
ncbi:MAG: cation:proton antiporter [Candidatus Limiplasma sp.]|nr:cation:proton antiporter [Candidatus Limiplasma sp.]